MKVLFIAPLYDRVNGMSFASEVFLEALKKNHTPVVINIAKSPAAKKKKFGSVLRVFEVFQVLWEVMKKKAGIDVIYFTISESLLGNFKDLLILLVCYQHLPRCVVHLHGGGGMREILSERHPWLNKINLYFLNKMAAIIVLGQTQTHLYAQVSDQKKIHIVPNFAPDDIFFSEEGIDQKFNQTHPLKILILSNFLPGKGQSELLEAFLSLDSKVQDAIEIDFAGDIASESQRALFCEKIKGFPQIRYHGIVRGEQKKKLLTEAHVFCLPTYYQSEGQPISILEAYAAGCAVIVTKHEGIADIFENQINGLEVIKKSPNSIAEAIQKSLHSTESLRSMAKHNLKAAREQYTVRTYNARLLAVLDQVSKN